MENQKEQIDHTLSTPASGWLDPAWRRRKRITVPREKLEGPLKDFTLLVDLEQDADLAQHARADGRDILFTAGDGVTPLSHERVVHQRLLRDQAVWTLWSDPRAVRHVGRHDRTYVAYYTTNQGWWISAFDHDSQQWMHHQLRSHEKSADGRWWDDHNNPSITVRNDGRIVAIYGEHSTEHSWTRISTEPEDISSWQEEIPFTQEQAIAKRENHPVKRYVRRAWAKLTGTKCPDPYQPSYSYVNLYTLPDGTLWRQYRPLRTWSGLSRNPTFVLSHDGGETWSDPVRFIDEEKRSPYLVTAQQGNKIHFFFSDAHPDEWNQTSIYHAYYDHAAGTYHRSDGSLIGDAGCLPFTPAQATKVYDGTTAAGEAWVYDIAVDAQGRLAGLFNVYAGEAKGERSYQTHDYWYAYWNGSQWETHRMATEADPCCTGQRRYSGGFILDTADVSVAYLSLVQPERTEHAMFRQPSRHIWKYTTPDNGKRWERERITRDEQGKAHSRPIVPLNRHPELPLFWLYGHYVNYLDYHTGLAAYDHGTLLDSRHHVKIPAIDPDRDLELYVYYDNEGAPDDSARSKEEVWSPACLYSYRGSLTQNALGQLPPRLVGSGFTLELVAVWASDRKGTGEAAILASDPASDTQLWIGKNHAEQLEVRFTTPSQQQAITFADLGFRARDWQQAQAPLERAVIQLSFQQDGAVKARMNGRQSQTVGELKALKNTWPTDLGLLRTAPEPSEGMPFQGWVEVVRLYEGELGDAWLTLSGRVEQEGAELIARHDETRHTPDQSAGQPS